MTKFILQRGKCKAIKNGIVRYRGRSSCNFEDGDDRYYVCYGWIDSMNDEPISECRNCCAYVYNTPRRTDEIPGYYEEVLKNEKTRNN